MFAKTALVSCKNFVEKVLMAKYLFFFHFQTSLLDPCSSPVSCLNGGSCLDQGNGIRLCQCREGFRGEDCGEATAATADDDDDDETTTEEVPKARVRSESVIII